jgi:hypothetical protein
LERPLTETAEPAETAAEPVVLGSEHIEESGEDEAVPEPDAAPAEPDHKALLHELAGHIRTVAASGKKDVTELLAWLASKRL